MIKRIFFLLFLAMLLFVAVLLIKTVTFSADVMQVEKITPVTVSDQAVLHLQQAIQLPTISTEKDQVADTVPFVRFGEFLQSNYPLVDSLLEKKAFNYSWLYKWQGSASSLAPVVLMGHLDVVPVDSATIDQWEAPPFSGAIKNGKIYGRGSMDDKINVVAIMEACEMLLKQGYSPKRTIYFAFGHDEEVGGENGARLMAEYLGSQGIRPEFVLDEGGFIADGMIDGIDKSLALINTGEKGYASFKIAIRTSGGHSSNPPTDNTIGSLAKAITELEANQFSYRMIPVVEEQIKRVGPYFEFGKKIAFANTWLLGKPILQALNAHTTIAPTILEGGVKDNVIPTQASVVVNFRIMPGETVADVRKHIESVIADDRISIESVGDENEPSRVSDHNTPSFQLIEKTIRQLHDDIVVSPGLLGAGTDSKHFLPICDNVYRFFPNRVNPSNVSGFHGSNEHMSVSNYYETIQFIHQLMLNL